MMSLLIFAGLISGLASPGFLSVNSQPAGMPVYVEGESVGITPLMRHQLEPGNYWVTVVSNDSLERLYQTVRTAAPGRRLAALWSLARIDAASTRVEILPWRSAPGPWSRVPGGRNGFSAVRSSGFSDWVQLPGW
ncbi:MAG: PEGA domain-containing protein [candidate division WOR-3 bacterium]